MGIAIPRVVIRTDSSNMIGSGHVMRCLTLAKALHLQGWIVSFVSRNFPGNLHGLLEQEGFTVNILPEVDESLTIEHSSNPRTWLGVPWQTDAQQTVEILSTYTEPVDWLIIDHYAIDAKWELHVKEFTRFQFVIDDLADRMHQCDILLNQNIIPNIEKRYLQLAGKVTRLLLGPAYALLRPEFSELRKLVDMDKIDPTRILVFFGGSDPTNQTLKTVEALVAIKNFDLSVDVVVGKGYPYLHELRNFCSLYPFFTIHVQTPDMANLLLTAGLAVGAGGTNTWERLCLGVPSVIVSVAENQITIAKAVHEQGMALYLGESTLVTSQHITDVVNDLLSNGKKLLAISKKCYETVDGCGVERVINVMHLLWDM